MIVSWFLKFFSWLLGVVFSPWPRVTDLPSYLDPIADNLGIISAIAGLPILGAAVQIGALVLLFFSTWQAIVFGNWIYNKVRGSG